MAKTVDMVGLGYCGLDTLCLVPHIPLDDKVEIRRTLIQGGGPAATATVTAARLGLRTAFVGAVGDDARADAILGELAREGVDTRPVRRRAGAESPAAFCWIAETTGQRSIAWTRGSAQAVTAAEVDPELMAGARALHLDGHQMAAAQAAAGLARGLGIPVFLDAGTMLPGIDELLRRCDVVIASQAFAERFTGSRDAETAVRRLAAIGPRWAGVTLGAAGSVGWDGQRLIRVPAHPVEVVDTTGAGDVYHGALLTRYLELSAGGGPGPELGACMQFASLVAAWKCRALGGRTGIPRRADLARGEAGLARA